MTRAPIRGWRSAPALALGLGLLLAPLATRANVAAPGTRASAHESASPAAREFRQALTEAKAGRLDAAFLLADRASQAEPKNNIWRTARDVLRQRAVLAHLERAHQLQLAGKRSAAAVEFRSALAVDPANAEARQGLEAAYPDSHPAAPDSTALRVKYAAPPVEIQPKPGERAFHFSLPLRTAIAQVAAAYGLKAYVADNLPEKSLRLDLERADFAQAMAALHDLADVDWIPLEPHTIYFAASGQLRQVQPLALRTFYVSWADTPIELTQVATVIRSLLGVDTISTNAEARALSVRASPEQLDATEKLLLELGQPVGEVVLEFRILELNATAARTLGVSEPDQFTMFALGPLLAQLQQNASQAQQILNLFEQGGLNGLLSSGQLPSGLLSQTQALSPLLQNPFVTFGGGATLMALSVPGVSAQFNASGSRVSSLETALMRADSGQAAELKVGERYPILNASFSPISLSPAISQVIGNGSYIQPFPSFTYQDLGLDAKITPEIEDNGDLHLQVDLTVDGLTGVSSNDIPILSNRHVVTEMSLKNGEPALLAGLFNRQEMTTLSGLPGIGQVPGIGSLFSTESHQTNQDQLALLVIPHVVRLPERFSSGLWLPANFAPAGNGSAFPNRPEFQVPNQPRLPFGRGRGGVGGGGGGGR